MPYADRLLADDEELVADLRPHPVFVLAPLVVVLAAAGGAAWIGVSFPQAPVAVAWVLAAMVAVPGLWLVGRVLRWRSIRLLVTSSRVVYRRGVLRRDVVQLRLQRVADVHCSQTVFDRLVGAGRVVFEVAGDAPLAVDDVRRPRAVQRMLADRMDQMDRMDRLDRLDRPDRVDRPAAGPAPDGWPPVPVRAPVPVGAPLPDETPPHGTPRVLDPPPPVADLPPSTAQAWDDLREPPPIPERLIALDDLHRRGVITDEEFAAKKAELLSRF